jgi:hypothetical protein
MGESVPPYTSAIAIVRSTWNTQPWRCCWIHRGRSRGALQILPSPSHCGGDASSRELHSVPERESAQIPKTDLGVKGRREDPGRCYGSHRHQRVGAGAWELARGSWGVGAGARELGRGSWGAGAGARELGRGSWRVGAGARELARGSWDAGAGARELARGSWRAGAGARELARGSWRAGRSEVPAWTWAGEYGPPGSAWVSR